MSFSRSTPELTPGVLFSRSDDGAVTWSVSIDSQKRVRRFLQLQAIAITRDHHAPGTLPLRLICLDGVHPKALKELESSPLAHYSIDGRAALEWEAVDPPHLERRYLSPLTVMAWSGSVSSLDAATRRWSSDLIQILRSSHVFADKSDPIKELTLDFESWCNQHFPASLVAHACRVFCLSAIPREAWARKQTGMTIKDQDPDDGVDTVYECGATSSLLDVAEDAAGSTINMAVLNMTLDIMREERQNEIDGLTKRRWAHGFTGLGARLLSADPRTAVLVAWAAHICENGTTQTPNPAASTVSRYIACALLKLGRAISDLPDSPFNWRTEQLQPLYATLVAEEAPSNRAVMSAALASFHQFLTEWFDLEPLAQSFLGNARTESRVQANVIWPHEIQWCMSTASQCADARMGLYSQAILAIAGNTPVRRMELMRLRIRNVKFVTGNDGRGAEIEIARDARRGRLKSIDSQRRLSLREPVALAVVQKLVDFRRSEGAPDSAFLFGDPGDDAQRYRPSSSENYVNALLKCATGQRSIRLHTLRHTAISNAVYLSWLSSPTADVSPLEMIAAMAGHASPATTLRSYSHLYEEPLRKWLDDPICEKSQLTTTEWANILGIRPNTLAQRVRRTGLSAAHLCWRTLEDTQLPATLPTSSDPFQWTTPTAPRASQAAQQGLVVGSVVWAIEQMRDGASDAAIAQRMLLPTDVLTRWRERLESDFRRWLGLQFPRKFSGNKAEALRLPALLVSLGARLERMWQPKYQTIAYYLQGSADDRMLKHAVESWRRCAVGIYLSLAAAARARDLLELLRKAGVMSSSLRICLQKGEGSARTSALEFDLRSVFTQVFDVPPVIHRRGNRDDRPVAYLLWSSAETHATSGSTKDGAADEIGGLQAWMVCIHAYLILKESMT